MSKAKFSNAVKGNGGRLTSEGQGLPRTMSKYRAGKRSFARGGGGREYRKSNNNNARSITRGGAMSSAAYKSYLNSRAAASMGLPVGANGISAPQSLNRRQEKAIAKMFRSVTSLVAGMEATKGWAFCHPPNVIWKQMGQQANEEFKYILQRYYKEFRWQAYLRKKQYGVCPYKPRQVGSWRVPVIPPLGKGQIKRYWDVEEEMWVYQWFWLNRPNMPGPDPDMRFKIWYEPDEDGNFTSPAVSALRWFKMLQITQTAGERAIYQASHMPYFATHQTPKMRPGDEKVEIHFGDDEEYAWERAQTNKQIEKAFMHRQAAKATFGQARAENRKRNRQWVEGDEGLIGDESPDDRDAREEDGILDNIVWMEDNWTVAKATPPALLVNPLEYEQRMDQIAASIVDFPLSMVIEQHAQHAGNYDAQRTYARDRMKEQIEDMNEFLREVILDIERDRLRDMYDETWRGKHAELKRPLTEEELVEVYTSVHDLEVEQPCTPLITYEELKMLWEDGLMSAQKLAEHAFHLFGIPQEDIEITELMRPAEIEEEKLKMEKQQMKQQHEETMKQMSIEKQSVDSTHELGTKKLQQEAKKTTVDHELGKEKLKIDAKKATAKPAGASKKKPAAKKKKT